MEMYLLRRDTGPGHSGKQTFTEGPMDKEGDVWKGVIFNDDCHGGQGQEGFEPQDIYCDQDYE